MKNKTIEKTYCKRCGYEWYPRVTSKPVMCPACKTRYWDIERKKPRE